MCLGQHKLQILLEKDSSLDSITTLGGEYSEISAFSAQTHSDNQQF